MPNAHFTAPLTRAEIYFLRFSEGRAHGVPAAASVSLTGCLKTSWSPTATAARVGGFYQRVKHSWCRQTRHFRPVAAGFFLPALTHCFVRIARWPRRAWFALSPIASPISSNTKAPNRYQSIPLHCGRSILIELTLVPPHWRIAYRHPPYVCGPARFGTLVALSRESTTLYH